MMRIKPMLAVKAEIEKLKFPVYASPKLDGVRVIILGGVVLSRSLKPIPNQHVQKLFGHKKYDYIDGELIVGETTDDGVFQKTSSGVMTKDGKPDVRLHAFDYCEPDYQSKPYSERLKELYNRTARANNDRIAIVDQELIDDVDKLNAYEEECVSAGYEGIMLRSLDGKYKQGRSTMREGYLLKVKRFEDDEAKLLGMEELMTNTNEQTVDKLGHRVRNHKKEGMVPAGKLGALLVIHPDYGPFKIGSGFTEEQRVDLWHRYLNNKNDFIGELVKFRYQPCGVKDKPRFPVFLGFRNKIDK